MCQSYGLKQNKKYPNDNSEQGCICEYKSTTYQLYDGEVALPPEITLVVWTECRHAVVGVHENVDERVDERTEERYKPCLTFVRRLHNRCLTTYSV